jgi:hypothetical protein
MPTQPFRRLPSEELDTFETDVDGLTSGYWPG